VTAVSALYSRRVGIAHWDEVPSELYEVGPLAAHWADLGSAAGSVTVGVNRVEILPGKRSTPVHSEGEEEEIFYVLGGTGLSWQEGETYEVRSGDCLVHLAGRETHTLVAGPDGLDVLAFGMRAHAEMGYLPRAGVMRHGRATIDLSSDDRHPWEREAAAGDLELPPPSPRPNRIVNVADVAAEGRQGETVASDHRELGGAAGSERTGLNHHTVPSGKLNVPPHCHSAEEEIFVVLEGGGTLELTPSPRAASIGIEPASHDVRPGSVVARPAGTRVAHTFRAGPDGLTLLAYGTRDPNDICYYPRSRKISWRGVGLIARVDHVDYWVDED
jgi:uncharacterized cupin superfamily protein